MKYFLKKLNSFKKKIFLNKSIRDGFRLRLVDFVLEGSDVRESEYIRRSMQRSNILNFLQFKLMPIFLIVVLLVSAGGGVSLAAEHSLPGDALYSVKVGFNEKIVAALSVSADAAANWEARLAERRLEEASHLAARGEIDADTEAKIRVRFEGHAEKVKERIAKMEEGGRVRNAFEIASRFEVALKVHEEILTRLQSANSAGVAVEIGKLKTKIRLELDEVAENGFRLESKIEKEGDTPETKTAVEGKIVAAENAIASVRTSIERNRTKLGAEAILRAETQLKVAADLLLRARSKFDAGVYGEAFVTAQKSFRAAREAGGLINDFVIEISIESEGGRDDERDDNEDGSRKSDANIDARDDEEGEVRGEGRVEVNIDL